MLRATRSKANWVFSFSLLLIGILALQLCSEQLDYSRGAILIGEVWRIWSGHFVHSNSAHLWLNLVASVLLYATLFAKERLRELLLYCLFFTSFISLGLLVFFPYIEWYNGLSGVLHALTIHYLAKNALQTSKLYWVGFGLVWLKVAVETLERLVGLDSYLGGTLVLSEAHLVGVILGSITALSLILSRPKATQ